MILEAQRLREVDSMISEKPSKNRNTDIEASPAVAKSRIEVEVLKKRMVLKAMIMPINVASDKTREGAMLVRESSRRSSKELSPDRR